MRVFSVNKEFGVGLSNCTFQVHNGDFIWVDDIYILNNVGLRNHITMIEYSYPEFNGNPPGRAKIHIKHSGYFYPKNSVRIKCIEDLIEENWITDITKQYNRSEKLKVCLEPEI
jgi:hypothetical protein